MRPLLRAWLLVVLLVGVGWGDPDDVRVPPEAARDPQSLAAYLVGTATTPQSKARRIYRWITRNINYDVPAIRGSRQSVVYEPVQVLQRRQTVCEGYARLFQALGKAAGLEVEVISGISHPSISEAAGGHAWNAVRLGGEWKLLDCTWGAGYVKGNDFYRSPTEYYFLTEPKVMASTHHPEDSQWQLLESPISKAEFVAGHPLRAPRAGIGERIELLAPGEKPAPPSLAASSGARLSAPRLLYGFHRRGATLHKPTQGTLTGSNHEFHLTVPYAEKIQVETGAMVYDLAPAKSPASSFRSLVPVAPGKVRVLGVFSGRSEPLAEFMAE